MLSYDFSPVTVKFFTLEMGNFGSFVLIQFHIYDGNLMLCAPRHLKSIDI